MTHKYTKREKVFEWPEALEETEDGLTNVLYVQDLREVKKKKRLQQMALMDFDFGRLI